MYELLLTVASDVERNKYDIEDLEELRRILKSYEDEDREIKEVRLIKIKVNSK